MLFRSTPFVRRPSTSTPARRAAIGSSSYPRGRAAAWNAAWLWEIAAADKRLGAHRVGCAGFVGDVGNWQEDRYHNAHYPDNDIGWAYRVGLARYLCLPLCEAGSLCRDAGRQRWTPTVTTRWSVPRAAAARCAPGRGPGTTAPATSWFAWARRPASGKGWTWTWKCYLFTRYRPSDIRVWIRPGGQDMHFEDSGANGFELPGAAPSADTAFKDVAYDVTIAATQTFNNGQYGHSIATRGPGTEAKAAIESKIAGYRAALADVQPLTNRRTKFVVLAFESSGSVDGPLKLVNVREQRASRRWGPDRR